MAYIWKMAAKGHIKVDANIAGKQFEELEKTVGLTPKNLLDANRAEDAPLHNEFEWDDTAAAEKYREEQASYLLRCICVETVDENKGNEIVPVRAFLSVEDAKPYENTKCIIENIDKRRLLLKRALRDLESLMFKYRQLKELDPIKIVIDEIRHEV